MNEDRRKRIDSLIAELRYELSEAYLVDREPQILTWNFIISMEDRKFVECRLATRFGQHKGVEAA